MKLFAFHSSPFTVAVVAAAAQTAATAATSDFTATTVRNWNGREGVTFVRYVSKDSSKVYGSAFCFDLSKGYRLKAWLGASNEPGCAPAAVGAMAEAIYASEGVAPVAGINGDYFDTSASYARPTGMVISDSELVSTGFGRVSLTANCYLAETGDHSLFHGKLTCVEGLAYGGQPTASWQLNARGRKVRNAIRTNYCNYPVKGGAINPVGSSSGESSFSTTIGNMQSRDYYYRTLVGIGTNAVGVATNLVLWSNTVYNGVLGIGDSPFRDVDAYQIMIDLGCNEVGELDGGGSATIWSESCPSFQNFFKGGTTAHGGYVNAYRDSSPRAVACGIFVMPPPAAPDAVALNDADTYPDMAEAMLAAVPGDSLTVLGAKPRHGTVVAGADGDRIAIEWAPDIVFGAIADAAGDARTNGVVSVRVAKAGTHLPDGCKLRLTVSVPNGATLGVIDQTLSGPGDYAFDTAGVIDPAAFGDGMLFDCTVTLLDPTGAPIASAATAQGSLRLADDAAWFSADAATATVKGGAWTAAPPVLQGAGVLQGAVPSAPVWSIQPARGAVFAANTPRDGLVRISTTLRQHGGYPESELPGLLDEAVANGYRAALVSVEEPDGSVSLRGLALVSGVPAWVPLEGVVLDPDTDVEAAMEFDLSGEIPMVSYLVATGRDAPTARLRTPTGAVWLPATSGGTDGSWSRPYQLAGGVSFGGLAEVSTLLGTTAIPGRTPAWRDVPADAGRGAYAVAVLGDSHFDASPDSVYHAAYDTSTPNAAHGIAEYRRSAEMWQARMPALLAASSALATPGASSLPTRFALQLGDIINGDCNDDAVHLRMLCDALAATRAPYAAALPFLTVLGNHDFRGSPNGRTIYFEWAEPLLSRELGENVAYPLFSFRIDDDRWIFCDFERVSLFDVAAEIESDPDARYVFLVSHGPFTPNQSGNNWIWRLSAWKGKGGTGKGVPELFEAISRRRAIVLSGHTHYTSFYRNENEYGGYTEFTANSVWKSADLAHANPFPGHDTPSAFGTWRMEEVSDANRAAYDADIALFKPGLREYFLGPGAGHFRLEVTDESVLMHFFPGDATEPGRTFDLTPGGPSPATVLFMR